MGVIEICYICQCGCITVKAHQKEAFKTSTFLLPLIHQKRYVLNDCRFPVFVLKIAAVLLLELKSNTVKFFRVIPCVCSDLESNPS